MTEQIKVKQSDAKNTIIQYLAAMQKNVELFLDTKSVRPGETISLRPAEFLIIDDNTQQDKHIINGLQEEGNAE